MDIYKAKVKKCRRGTTLVWIAYESPQSLDDECNQDEFLESSLFVFEKMEGLQEGVYENRSHAHRTFFSFLFLVIFFSLEGR